MFGLESRIGQKIAKGVLSPPSPPGEVSAVDVVAPVSVGLLSQGRGSSALAGSYGVQILTQCAPPSMGRSLAPRQKGCFCRGRLL